jgi:hypothetical protein
MVNFELKKIISGHQDAINIPSISFSRMTAHCLPVAATMVSLISFKTMLVAG